MSQITTPQDHVHALSVDGARIQMIAEAITEAFPEDRSFFRTANQLGKQQGHEPEKLQGTARVHCYVDTLVHDRCFLFDAPSSGAPVFGFSALYILPVHITLMPSGACRLDLSVLVSQRSRMWRWWRFRKAIRSTTPSCTTEEWTLNARFSRSGDVCVHAPSRLRLRSGRMVVFNLLE